MGALGWGERQGREYDCCPTFTCLAVWGLSGVLPLLLPLPVHPQEYPLAALAGTACHCGFPTMRFPLHEREDEQLCAQKCSAEEFESCGTASYFIVYQTQVQGRPGRPGSPRVFSALLEVPWSVCVTPPRPEGRGQRAEDQTGELGQT